MKKTGKVWLAGAGPGDAGLLTIKTRELLESKSILENISNKEIDFFAVDNL